MKLHITASGFDLGSELEKYASGKAAQLNKEIPRKLRAQSVCDMHFAQTKGDELKVSTCTILVKLGEEEFHAEESTQHMYAALDIATVHMEHQLDDYLLRHGLKKPAKRDWQVP